MGGILTPAPTSGRAAGRAGAAQRGPLPPLRAAAPPPRAHPHIPSGPDLPQRRSWRWQWGGEGDLARSPRPVTSAKLAAGLSPSSAILRGLKREG